MQIRYSEEKVPEIAQKVLSLITPSESSATIVGFSGELGAGKTTLAKAIGKLLGVEHDIQSPTFVIARFYKTSNDQFCKLIHVDAYRIESLDELKPLQWDSIVKEPQTLVIIEWPERITGALPVHTKNITLLHDTNERILSYE